MRQAFQRTLFSRPESDPNPPPPAGFFSNHDDRRWTCSRAHDATAALHRRLFFFTAGAADQSTPLVLGTSVPVIATA